MAETARHRPPPKLVLFDLDDTLCDHYFAYRHRLRRALSAALEAYPGIEIEALVERAAAHPGGITQLAALLAEIGVVDESCAERAGAIYASDRLLGLELYPESIEVIERVSLHAAVGLITNGPSAIQREKIRRLALEQHFPVILVSEEEGIWKPDPQIFVRALARVDASIDPSEAAYVGDSPEHDIAGARAAGLQTVWVNRRGRLWPTDRPPDVEIQDLRDLPQALGLLAPSSGIVSSPFQRNQRKREW